MSEIEELLDDLITFSQSNIGSYKHGVHKLFGRPINITPNQGSAIHPYDLLSIRSNQDTWFNTSHRLLTITIYLQLNSITYKTHYLPRNHLFFISRIDDRAHDDYYDKEITLNLSDRHNFCKLLNIIIEITNYPSISSFVWLQTYELTIVCLQLFATPYFYFNAIAGNIAKYFIQKNDGSASSSLLSGNDIYKLQNKLVCYSAPLLIPLTIVFIMISIALPFIVAPLGFSLWVLSLLIENCIIDISDNCNKKSKLTCDELYAKYQHITPQKGPDDDGIENQLDEGLDLYSIRLLTADNPDAVASTIADQRRQNDDLFEQVLRLC